MITKNISTLNPRILATENTVCNSNIKIQIDPAEAAKIIPENLPQGVTLFGVPGSHVCAGGYTIDDYLAGIMQNVASIVSELASVNYNVGGWNMTSISMPNLTPIPNSFCQNCKSLVNINFPAATSCGFYTFNGCTALVNVAFPNLKSISTRTFMNCSNLEKFDAPLTSVTDYIWYNSPKLETLILRGPTVCDLGASNSLLGTKIAAGTGYIYVPAALVNDYKAATNWSVFAAQFRAIEDYPEICGS